jgi:hypothetical protein
VYTTEIDERFVWWAPHSEHTIGLEPEMTNDALRENKTVFNPGTASIVTLPGAISSTPSKYTIFDGTVAPGDKLAFNAVAFDIRNLTLPPALGFTDVVISTFGVAAIIPESAANTNPLIATESSDVADKLTKACDRIESCANPADGKMMELFERMTAARHNTRRAILSTNDIASALRCGAM